MTHRRACPDHHMVDALLGHSGNLFDCHDHDSDPFCESHFSPHGVVRLRSNERPSSLEDLVLPSSGNLDSCYGQSHCRKEDHR